MIEEDVSSTFIDMIFRPLRKIFTEAHEDGLIQTNPIKRVKTPSKQSVSSSQTWSEEESVRFLQRVRERFMNGENRTYIIYSVALFTGMRIGEILALTWENVNLDEKYIMVKQIIDNYGKLKKRTKSKSSTRMIMISDALVEDLRLQKEAQEIEMEHYKYSTNLVISTKKGNPFVPANISCKDFVTEIEQVPDLKKIGFHDLRHTHASLLMAKEIPAKVVQERLGHSSISITLDIYSHVVPQLQREVATKLDTILSVAM